MRQIVRVRKKSEDQLDREGNPLIRFKLPAHRIDRIAAARRVLNRPEVDHVPYWKTHTLEPGDRNMKDSPTQPEAHPKHHHAGLLMIAGYKLLGATICILIGVGAMRLAGKDIDDVLAQIATFWRLPE